MIRVGRIRTALPSLRCFRVRAFRAAPQSQSQLQRSPNSLSAAARTQIAAPLQFTRRFTQHATDQQPTHQFNSVNGLVQVSASELPFVTRPQVYSSQVIDDSRLHELNATTKSKHAASDDDDATDAEDESDAEQVVAHSTTTPPRDRQLELLSELWQIDPLLRNPQIITDATQWTIEICDPALEDTVQSLEVSEARAERRQLAIAALSTRLSPLGKLELYGSTLTDLATRHSDIDVAIRLNPASLLGQELAAYEAQNTLANGLSSLPANRPTQEADKETSGLPPVTPRQTALSEIEKLLRMSQATVFDILSKNSVKFDPEARDDYAQPIAITRAARVPIIKLKSLSHSVIFRLTLWRAMDQHLSALLLAYRSVLFANLPAAEEGGKEDFFFKDFIVAIKEWATQRRIKNAGFRTTSSYSLTLMAIAYLQQIGVFPNLQHESVANQQEQQDAAARPVLTRVRPYAGEEQHWTDNLNEESLTKLSVPKEWLIRARSTEFKLPSVGEALIGFWHFYACVYNPLEHIISVRHGGLVKREKLLDDKTNGQLFVTLDPFQIADSASRSVDLVGAIRIRNEMLRALQIVDNTNALYRTMQQDETIAKYMNTSPEFKTRSLAFGREIWSNLILDRRQEQKQQQAAQVKLKSQHKANARLAVQVQQKAQHQMQSNAQIIYPAQANNTKQTSASADASGTSEATPAQQPTKKQKPTKAELAAELARIQQAMAEAESEESDDESSVPAAETQLTAESDSESQSAEEEAQDVATLEQETQQDAEAEQSRTRDARDADQQTEADEDQTKWLNHAVEAEVEAKAEAEAEKDFDLTSEIKKEVQTATAADQPSESPEASEEPQVAAPKRRSRKPKAAADDATATASGQEQQADASTSEPQVATKPKKTRKSRKKTAAADVSESQSDEATAPLESASASAATPTDAPGEASEPKPKTVRKRRAKAINAAAESG